MNEIILTLTEKNILDSLLYSASKSDPLKKSRKMGRILFGVIFLLLTLIFLFLNKFIAGVVFVVAAITFILFPQYLKIYYKKYFTKLSKSQENKKLIGLEYRTTLSEDYLESNNIYGESKFFYSNFEYISETKENFFIKLKTQVFIMFPKSQIEKINELKHYFQEVCTRYQIEYINDENWVWR
ncbi:YcxB family protein [Chryseobacterium sp. SIMBA_029]|uniref:YcxB family protein n=1 Tax=Chryseobacterium sp. SIMBA_029 TaxID=3085772 RepID=UPI00397D0B6E